jgi:DUF1365 family protein
MKSALYFGEVVHRRTRPRIHALRYSIFQMLFDLDELPAMDRSLRLFGHNRFALFGFYDRDHGDGSATPLRAQIEMHLKAADIDLAGGPIRLLCMPRILGYVFNPINVYFCHRPEGELAAMLYEVNNTFGQRHSYLLPVEQADGPTVVQSCRKQLYVSPFMAMDMRYDFRVLPPGPKVGVSVNVFDDKGLIIATSFNGRRFELSDRILAKAFLRHPLLTLKVIAGIHWEALRLWRKGTRMVPRPPAPDRPVTIVAKSEL